MQDISITSKSIPSTPRSGNYPKGTTVINNGGSSVTYMGDTIDIIKQLDSTQPSDANTFSALRTIKEITDRAISKTNNDEVPSVPNFKNGLRIGDAKLLFDSINNSLYIKKPDDTPVNFYATGGVSAYGSAPGSTPGSGGIDETTLWSIMGNTGSQQIAANHLATALSPYVTQSAMSAALINYAPINHGHVWGDITDRPSSLPASDVYAWAKAISKPTYAFSEITDKPSTLGGYGITDAAAKSHSHVWADITDRPTKLSQFTNDIISTWALAASKPSYSYSEISGTPDLSSLHTHSNKDLLDAINQNLSSTGSPIFTKITIGAICLAFDSVNNSLYVQKSDGTSANFYATGGVSSYGAGSSSGTGSGIDETTLWSIMGNTGTQQIAANHLATALSPYMTQTAMSALLTNYAPINHGHVWGDITDRPASLPASDVYAWAKATTKPNYDFSEITGKPSTLGGYGITDAAAKSHSHLWADITDRPASLPASDVYAWAKTATKPSYSYSEITGKPSTLGGYGITDAMTALNINNLVTSSINSVQIGSTNLFQNSKVIINGQIANCTSNGATLSVDTTNTYNGNPTLRVVGSAGFYMNFFPIIEPDVTYTVSMMVKGDSEIVGNNLAPLHIQVPINAHNYENIISWDDTITTSWRQIWKTFKSTSTNNELLRLYLYFIGDIPCNVAWVKLEKGNKATDWSPAPEEKLNTWDNAVSATKLYTPRSFTIGNTAKSFDGTSNVSWSLSEIGAAAAIHSHSISQITDIGNASVNYAASAGNADTLDGVHESSFLRFRGRLLDGKNALSGVQTTGFVAEDANYQTTWGDSLHIQGFSSWYNRLDFGTDGRIYFYQAINPDSTTGCMTYKGTLAYLSDNVASATRLQTARSVWGQSFDGSGDINGNIVLPSDMRICIKGNDYGHVIRHYNNDDLDGFGVSIGFCVKYYNDDINPIFLIHNGYGNSYFNGNGNFGIGITSPSYKLHVSGTGYFSDSLNLAATLSAAGLINANGNIKTNNYIEIGSTGIRIMYDSTNDCLKLIKSDGSAVNLLVTGGVTALATA